MSDKKKKECKEKNEVGLRDEEVQKTEKGAGVRRCQPTYEPAT